MSRWLLHHVASDIGLLFPGEKLNRGAREGKVKVGSRLSAVRGSQISWPGSALDADLYPPDPLFPSLKTEPQ